MSEITVQILAKLVSIAPEVLLSKLAQAGLTQTKNNSRL